MWQKKTRKLTKKSTETCHTPGAFQINYLRFLNKISKTQS